MRAVRAISIGILVAACGGPSAPSPSTVPASLSPGPESSAGASPLPSAASVGPTDDSLETDPPAAGTWMEEAPKPLLVGRSVRVIVDDLNIRRLPSTSARIEGSVARDDHLVVALYPAIEADGYIWYYGSAPSPAPSLGGWFAAMKGQTPYVEMVAARCPQRIELETISVMVPGDRVACFGDQSIELEGTLSPPPAVPPEIFGDFKPRWLADPNIVNLVIGELDAGIGLNLRIPPSVTERPDDGPIRARGHFDDPLAADCAVALDTPWRDLNPIPAPGAFARLWCRQMFVVDAWEVWVY